MKTLHIEAGMHLYGGGLQVLFLLRGLQAQGEPGVLVCPKGSAIAEAARPHALRVHEITMRGDADLGIVGRVRRLIREERPDLVHLHSRRGSDVWGALAARLEGIPTVMSRRNDTPEPSWWWPIKYRLYDRVVAISEGIRQVLLGLGLPPGMVVCVRSAVDAERFRPGREDLPWLRGEFGLGDDEQTVAMAAQFIARKGHRTLLAALPEVLAAHPRTRVLLFGRGPELDAMRRLVSQMGLVERVMFCGFRNDLQRVLPCVDVLVHPAETEGLGVVLLQAAACGVPIVACRAGGMPEIVHPGINGELIEPGDHARLAAHLKRLLADASLRQRYGAAGRELVLRDFSVDAMVEGNRAVYRAVCKVT